MEPSDIRDGTLHHPGSNVEEIRVTDESPGSTHTQNSFDQAENSHGSAHHASTTGQGAVTATHSPDEGSVPGTPSLPRQPTSSPVVAPIDYSQGYPPSPPFKEAGPTSSVWRAYLDESRSYDTDRLQDQRGEVNILLVFAGLFSAVVSAFVVQSLNSQPDYQKMSAVLLFDQINIQRALANGTSLDDITTSGIDPTAPFTPDTTDLVINGLWGTSLTLSLVTAFVAILVDAWYSYYVSPIPGQPEVRASTRHLRYKGLIKCHIRVCISFLQLLLHLSLMSFLLGFSLF
ncbi:hypothetical protein EV421DRAFT_2063533, partial [Armillaria borealis]